MPLLKVKIRPNIKYYNEHPSNNNGLYQGCTNPWCQEVKASKFWSVTPNISASSVWKLLHIAVLAPRNLRCCLDFWKIYAPLLYIHLKLRIPPCLFRLCVMLGMLITVLRVFKIDFLKYCVILLVKRWHIHLYKHFPRRVYEITALNAIVLITIYLYMLHAFANSRKGPVNFVMPFHPYQRCSNERISSNFILGASMKVCRGVPNLVKIE